MSLFQQIAIDDDSIFDLDDEFVIEDETADSHEEDSTIKLNDVIRDIDSESDVDEIETTDSHLKPKKEEKKETKEVVPYKEFLSKGEIVNDSCFSHQSDWARMHLSKPLLKALNDLDFKKPTIIQRDAIPLALQGRDVLGTAQTGKTIITAFYGISTLWR